MSAAEIMVCVQEVCVLSLLNWAATWSAAAGSAQICASVAQFLECSLVLVHVTSKLHNSREDWHAGDEECGAVTAVWLEERDGSIEWTVVQQQQQQQHGTLLHKLNILANAVNDFPQFPALRSLGDV